MSLRAIAAAAVVLCVIAAPGFRPRPPRRIRPAGPPTAVMVVGARRRAPGADLPASLGQQGRRGPGGPAVRPGARPGQDGRRSPSIPRDFTSGCTAEMQTFAEQYDSLFGPDVVVVGISTDSLETHTRFAASLNLPFRLLSDPTAAGGPQVREQRRSGLPASGRLRGRAGRQGDRTATCASTRWTRSTTPSWAPPSVVHGPADLDHHPSRGAADASFVHPGPGGGDAALPPPRCGRQEAEAEASTWELERPAGGVLHAAAARPGLGAHAAAADGVSRRSRLRGHGSARLPPRRRRGPAGVRRVEPIPALLHHRRQHPDQGLSAGRQERQASAADRLLDRARQRAVRRRRRTWRSSSSPTAIGSSARRAWRGRRCTRRG